MLREDKVTDLRRALRGVISRLNALEAEALTLSRQAVTAARRQVEFAVPESLGPEQIGPFLTIVNLQMERLGTEFESLILGFAAEGADMGEEFANAQLVALGIDPQTLPQAGLAASEFRSQSRGLAGEAKALIRQAGAKLEAEAARAFLGEKPSRKGLLDVIRANMSVRRSEGSLSGVIARIATNLRTALGRFFSLASEQVQKEAEKVDKNLRKIWVTKGDAKVRPDHVRAGIDHGTTGNPGPIGVKKRFKVGQARLRFPRDPDAKGSQRAVQAQVINCRCDSVLIRVEEE